MKTCITHRLIYLFMECTLLLMAQRRGPTRRTGPEKNELTAKLLHIVHSFILSFNTSEYAYYVSI